MRKILSFKDFGLYEYQKFDHSLYNKINEATFLDENRQDSIDQEAFKKVRSAVFFLNASYPFFGSLLARLLIRENRGIKTMCTDGISIHYSPAFVHEHTDDEIMWVIAHEILHCALLHFLRMPAKDKVSQQIWNYATDYAINQMLTPVVESTPGDPKPSTEAKKSIGKMPAGALYPGCGRVPYDKEFVGLSSDGIYDMLIAKGFKPDDDDDTMTTPPPPPPPPAPPKIPEVGDIIFDPSTGNYGVVNSVDEANDEVDYDPIPKEKVPVYLRKKYGGDNIEY
jgi:hypothetical protein